MLLFAIVGCSWRDRGSGSPPLKGKQQLKTNTTTKTTKPITLGNYDTLVTSVADWMEQSHSPIKLGVTILVDAILEFRDRESKDGDISKNARYQVLVNIDEALDQLFCAV